MPNVAFPLSHAHPRTRDVEKNMSNLVTCPQTGVGNAVDAWGRTCRALEKHDWPKCGKKQSLE